MPGPPTQPLPAANSYDEVPYDSHPFPQAHPDRLATVATLFGLCPPPVHRCRVLELGCAAGGHLIPMAEQLPESQFIGVDLSARQVADGRRVVEQLGLANVELRHASILDVDDRYGPFDYVVCHGVYSWVPPPVQDKILEVAARLLAPHGVAYVSYNTYPGWHLRALVRGMMRYHALQFASPALRTRQARALLDFLAGSVRQDGGAYATLLKAELETLRRQPDSYLFHEHLEEVNDPLFFYQFVERLAARGLRYLGEARVASMALSGFQADVVRTLRVLAPDQVQAEQYMDFLRNRTFRQTLVCRQEAPVDWSVPPEVLRGLYFASRSIPVQEPVDLRGTEPVTYRAPGGATLATALPLMKAALQVLREAWPLALPFERLRRLARKRLGEPAEPRPAEDLPLLGVGLLNGHLAADLVELRAAPVACVASVTERPVASPLARLQAAHGPLVTTRRHEAVRLSDLEWRLLPLLDGRHDRAGLLDGLVESAVSGAMKVKREGEVLRGPAAIRAALDEVLDRSLKGLAMNALLVG